MRSVRMCLATLAATAAATAVAGVVSYGPADGAVKDPFLTVSFPSDTTVNTTVEPYTVTVDDRRGSGTLFAEFGDYRQEVAHQGSTDVVFPFPWARGEVVIIRCTTGLTGSVNCVDTGYRSPTIRIQQRLDPGQASTYPIMVSPNGDGIMDSVAATMSVYPPEPVSVNWSYKDTHTDTVIGTGGPVAATPDADGNLSFPLVPSGVPSGRYELSFALHADDPDFGALDGTIEGSIDSTIIVDLEPPGPASFEIDDTTIYPYIEGMWSDAYPLTTEIAVSVPDQHNGDGRLEMIDSSGAVVRTRGISLFGWNWFEWDGRDDDGNRVPAGAYQARVVATDSAGNTTEAVGPTVEVSPAKLVERSLSRTLTPSKAVARHVVGRCSQLRRPSSRGWPGSLGLYSNVRCKGTTRDSRVVTIYRVPVPRDRTSLGPFIVTAVGGAGSRAPRSTATVAFRTSNGWQFPQELGPRLGSHEAHLDQPHSYDGEPITFAIRVDGGNRYDLKRIRIHLSYMAVE